MNSLLFLGRSQHAAALEECLDSVRQGRHVVLTIEGTAGTGKSRLLDEFVRRLDGDDLDLRRATAYPASATEPGGIADALELDAVGADRVTVILIDDAQWVDATSLTRLQSLALQPGGAGLLLVLTYRPLDEDPAPGLHRLLEAAGRRGTLRQLSLGPITVADLADVVGGPDPAALADRLATTSGGAAATLAHLVDQLISDGMLRWEDDQLVPARPLAEWPETRWLHERITELSADERLVVTAAALADRPLPLAVVGHLVDRDVDDALTVAEGLVDKGFLTESTAGFQPRTSTESEALVAELGEARKGRTFEALAEAMEQAGFAESQPGLLGTVYRRARRHEDALPLLAEAGLSAADHNALAEALPLVTGALDTLEHTGSRDQELKGRLLFARAKSHRMLGWTELAAEDAAEASRLLTGVERMRALGWQAQIADDAQHATEGEWLTAAAELEAARLGDEAARGLQLTLRAKMLGRLGMPVEADACLRRGIQLLRRHGDPNLQFFGHWNGAWVYFDRGQVSQAEGGFEYTVNQARHFEGEQWLADSQAWWSRTLFWTGRVTDALDAYAAARDTADRAASQGPMFLTALGRAEGMLLLGRYDDAQTDAEETLDHIRRMGLAWENVGHYLLASAHLGAGRLDAALAEAEQAVAGCPPGLDGQRWRAASRALLVEIKGARGEPWPTVEAARLTRELLAGRWLAPAIRLLSARARHEENAEAGHWAVALALEVGIPMLAARAAADLGDEPIALAVHDALRRMADHIPEEWREEWAQRPDVAPALEEVDASVSERQEASDQLRLHLRDALAWVGLDPADLRLGPDEWTAPLPRLKTSEPRRRAATVIVASVAAVLVLGAGALGVNLLGSEEPTPPDAMGTPDVTSEPEPDPTTRVIAAPEHMIGHWTFRGGPERTGVSDRSGTADLDGRYWDFCTGQPIYSSPALHGNFAFFGSDDGNVYALDTRTGRQTWSRPTDGRVRSSPVVASGVGAGGLEERDNLVIAGSDDGNVYAWTARGGDHRWTFPTDGEVRSSPIVIDGTVLVGSRDGHLYAIDVANGEELWRFPADDETTIGRIDASPAVWNNLAYIGADDGMVHAVDITTGELEWTAGPLGGGIVATPAVYDGVVYVGSLDQNVWSLEAATGRTAGIGTYRTDTQVRSSPALADGILYVASNIHLIAIDLATAEVAVSYETGSQIESSPTIAGDIVYVGSDDGYMHAFDRESGESLWRFPTERKISTSPAVADGAVIVASWDGCVYALGAEQNGD